MVFLSRVFTLIMFLLCCILRTECSETNQEARDNVEFPNFSVGIENSQIKKNLRTQQRFHPYSTKDSDVKISVSISEDPKHMNELVMNEEPNVVYMCEESQMVTNGEYVILQNFFENTYNYSVEIVEEEKPNASLHHANNYTSNVEKIKESFVGLSEQGEYFTLTMDESMLNSMIQDIWNDQNAMTMKEELGKFVDSFNNESEFSTLFESPTDKNTMNSASTSYNIETEDHSIDSVEELPSCSGLTVQQCTNDAKQNNNDYNEKDEEKKEEKDTETDNRKIKGIHRLKSICLSRSKENIDGIQIAYLPIFKKAVLHLSKIIKFIKYTDDNEVEKIKLFITNLVYGHWLDLERINCDLSFRRPNKYNNSLTKILYKCAKYNATACSTQQKFEPIEFLDTFFFINVYFQLLMSFSMNNIWRQNAHLKGFFKKNETVLNELPNDLENILHDTNKLKDIFTQLSLPIQIKCTMYKLQYYYRMIFQMHDDSSCIANDCFILHSPEMIYYISDLLHNIIAINNNLLENRKTNIFEIIRKIEDEKTQKFSLDSTLLMMIAEKKETLKNNIKNSFEESETLSKYMLHHLGFLLFQRLLQVKKSVNDIQDHMKLYKSFLELFSHLSSKINIFTSFYELKEEEIHVICNNEYVLRCIISYLNLSVLDMVIKEVNIDMNKFLLMLKESYNNGIAIVKGQEHQDWMELLTKSITSLADLKEMLLTINTFKDITKKYYNFFNLEEEINNKINDIIQILDQIKFKKIMPVTNSHYSRIINTYNEIRLHHKKLSYIVNVEL